jgi:hypothetical protein
MPLSFRFGNTESARIRANDIGNLFFATLNGTDKNIFFRAGDDSGTDMFIQSSTGNVGIGTTSPDQRLEVSNGAVLSSGANGGRFTIHNPNNQSASAHFDWFNDTARIRYGGTGVGASNGFVIQGPGDITKLQIADSGQVFLGEPGSVSDSLTVNGQIFAHVAEGNDGDGHLCGQPSSGFTLIVRCTLLSSARFKTDVIRYKPGLDLLNRFRPVTFRWKNSGRPDFGLIAEEVARIEPRLVTYNKNGEVEGVKYDRIGVVLLNAVQEQQTQIKSQQAQIKEQRQQLRAKDNRISSLEQRLARYESSLAVYESRLASLENSVARVTRPTRRVIARTPGTKRGRTSARKAD